MKTKETQWKIYKQPDFVGCYNINGEKTYQTKFHFTKKPKAIHRFFCKLCLGWTWTDNN